MLDKLVDKIGELTVREQVAFFTTTWKAADSLLADSLKVAMAKAAPTKAAAKAA